MKVSQLRKLLEDYADNQEVMTADFNEIYLVEYCGDLFITDCPSTEVLEED